MANNVQFQGSSALLLHYVSGALLAFAGAFQVIVGLGQFANVTSTALITIRDAITVDVRLVGAGGLDVGAVAANSFYYVYAIAGEAVGVSAVASLSASAPALPAGYTTYRRLDSFRTDGLSNIFPFTKSGTGRDRRTLWFGIDTWQILVNNGASNVPALFSCIDAMPATSGILIAALQIIADPLNSSGLSILLPPSNLQEFGMSCQMGGEEQAQRIELEPNVVKTLLYQVDNVGAAIVLAEGYEETI